MPSITLTVDIPDTQNISPGTTGSPTVITRDGSLTIVTVNMVTDSDYAYVQLPSDCVQGDIVEVYYVWSPTFVANAYVFPPSGETFVNDAAQVFACNRFRKIGSTLWGWLKGADVEI